MEREDDGVLRDSGMDKVFRYPNTILCVSGPQQDIGQTKRTVLWSRRLTSRWSKGVQQNPMIKHSRKGPRIVGGLASLILLSTLLLGGHMWNSMQSSSDLIPVGQAAPDFTAVTNEGGTVRLSELRGRKRLVLVFYPGDGTPVCTAQLCAFRDNWSAVQSENAVVYGVNPANRERHSGFASKNGLPFPLLVDTNSEIAGRYGCRALFGIVKRTVYIIDRNGRIVWVQRGNPSPSEILRELHGLKDSSPFTG